MSKTLNLIQFEINERLDTLCIMIYNKQEALSSFIKIFTVNDYRVPEKKAEIDSMIK